MTAATARDPLTPPQAPSAGRALALSLLAHALLVLALAWGVKWSRTDPMVSFSAEIWSPTVQEAAPAPPPPPPPAPPEPEAPKAPPPPPPSVLRQQAQQREADLALEKRRKEEKQKALTEQAEKLTKEKAAKEKQAREKAQKDKLEREKAEKDKAEQARKLKEKEQKDRDRAKEEARKEQARKEAAEQDKLRQDQLRRMKAQLASASSASTATSAVANATGGPNAQGSAPRSAAPSSSYAGKIVQLIKDNTRYTDPNAGAWSVVVMVRTERSGRITEAKVVTTSGNRAFDDAVLRGVQKMEFVPKDVDGRVPEVLLREGLEIKVTL